MKDFRTLDVWQRSHQLTLALYRATAGFPRDEGYGLTSQLRRAGASVPANLAEGCGRASDADVARFLVIALGSASELEYHLLLAHDLGYLDTAAYQHLAGETTGVKRMLTGLLKTLRTDRR